MHSHQTDTAGKLWNKTTTALPREVETRSNAFAAPNIAGAPSVTLPPADELGRAMLALNDKQRRFVLELGT